MCPNFLTLIGDLPFGFFGHTRRFIGCISLLFTKPGTGQQQDEADIYGGVHHIFNIAEKVACGISRVQQCIKGSLSFSFFLFF